MHRKHRNKEKRHIQFSRFLNPIVFWGGVKVKDVKNLKDQNFFKNINDIGDESTTSTLPKKSFLKKCMFFVFFLLIFDYFCIDEKKST